MSAPIAVDNKVVATVIDLAGVKPIQDSVPDTKIQVLDLITAVGAVALSDVRSADHRASWVPIEDIQDEMGKVKPIYIDSEVLLALGCTKEELATPKGKAKFAKIVSTLTYFSESGFSKPEILAAMTFAPGGRSLTTRYPDLLAPYLRGEGVSSEIIEKAEKANMLPVLANLYLADFYQNFKDEISLLGDILDNNPGIIESHILLHQSSIMIDMYLTDALKNCYQSHLKLEREEDKIFLRRIGCPESIIRKSQDIKKTCARNFAKWLKKCTTFEQILDHIVYCHSTNTEIIEFKGRESIRMTPQTLQEIFKGAVKARFEGKVSFSPPPGSGIPGAFLAVAQQGGKALTLIYWSGRYDSTLTQLSRCLGVGGWGCVQTVDDMATGNELAFKTVKADFTGEKFKMAALALKNEWHVMKLLNRQPASASEFVPMPHCFIEDGNLMGILMKKYRCDILDITMNPSLVSMTVGDMYSGLISVLESIRTLNKHGIVHRDLRLENVFVDTTSGKPQFVLGDFGFSADTGFIIRNSRFETALMPEPIVAAEEFQLMNRVRRQEPKEELAALLKKREVFAFGRMVVMLLTGQQWDAMPNAQHFKSHIGHVYGENVNDILMQTLSYDISKRPTIENLIAAFKEIVNDPTPEGQKRLKVAFNEEDQALARGEESAEKSLPRSESDGYFFGEYLTEMAPDRGESSSYPIKRKASEMG